MRRTKATAAVAAVAGGAGAVAAVAAVAAAVPVRHDWVPTHSDGENKQREIEAAFPDVTDAYKYQYLFERQNKKLLLQGLPPLAGQAPRDRVPRRKHDSESQTSARKRRRLRRKAALVTIEEVRSK